MMPDYQSILSRKLCHHNLSLHRSPTLKRPEIHFPTNKQQNPQAAKQVIYAAQFQVFVSLLLTFVSFVYQLVPHWENVSIARKLHYNSDLSAKENVTNVVLV